MGVFEDERVRLVIDDLTFFLTFEATSDADYVSPPVNAVSMEPSGTRRRREHSSRRRGTRWWKRGGRGEERRTCSVSEKARGENVVAAADLETDIRYGVFLRGFIFNRR